MSIRFNKPYIQGNEYKYLRKVIDNIKLSGGGEFTKKCHQFFQERYGFKKTLLTTSGTDALEMSAILTEIGQGDEVIMPSYTFVSTANAFVLRGAKIKFADIQDDVPNIDPAKIEKAITKNTKAIVVVHYAGIACDMDPVMEIARNYNLYVIEDAAQAIESYYKGYPLGSIGDIGIFSFHETKNIISGEGGLCIINNEDLIERAEIIWEKGTNRQAFQRGEVDKYSWVDVGSSFLPSELIAGFLYAQLENLDVIIEKRLRVWNKYFHALEELNQEGYITLPSIPSYATNNAHIFYLMVNNKQTRKTLLEHLNANGIKAIFHYVPLHSSPFFTEGFNSCYLENTEKTSNLIIRLPLFCELEENEQNFIINEIYTFYSKKELDLRYKEL